MLVSPKTLEDAKTIIENTVTNSGSNSTWLNKVGLDRVQEAIDNFNRVCSTVDGIFNAIGSTCSFIGKCFTQPGFFIEQLQIIAPEILLVVLGILIILKILGFKDTTKWIYFGFVLAIVIAAL